MRRGFFVVVVLLGFCVWARGFFFFFFLGGGGHREKPIVSSKQYTYSRTTAHAKLPEGCRRLLEGKPRGDVTFEMNSNISYPQTDTHRSSVTITILTHPWGTVKQAGKGDKTSLPLPHHLSVSPLQCPFSLNACPK